MACLLRGLYTDDENTDTEKNMTDHTSNKPSSAKSWLISLVILLAGAGFSWLIFSTEPEAQREGATRKSAMLVDVTPVQVGDYSPIIEAMGTVVPAKEIELQARVSGEVTGLADTFIPGTIIQAGKLLVELDDTDYQLAAQQAQVERLQAQAALHIEQGEQLAARQQYEQLGREVSEPQKSLILRAPQLQQAEAAVMLADTRLQQARTNQERTRITAPFTGKLLSTGVNLGSQVSPGDDLGHLVGVDRWWIEATLPTRQLQWLDQENTAAVMVHDRQAWTAGVMREGSLISVLGQVDEQTRLAQVLIAVDDPLGLYSDQPALIMGAFVNTRIPAKLLTQVARIQRELVRKQDTIWLMNDEQLEIRTLNVVFRDEQYVYVKGSLKAGEHIVTTDLSRVIDGAALRLNSDQSNGN